MGPRWWARCRAAAAGLGAVLALGCTLTGCGPADVTGQQPVTAPTQPAPLDVPLVDARWQEMPQAPLSPRGSTSTVWTGDRLLLLGGGSVDAEQEPCPPAASCAAPPSTAHDDGAAWDPAARTWTRLQAVGTYPLSQSPILRWTGTRAVGVGGTGTPDLAAGTIAWERFSTGEALVYDEPSWTGTELVASGWDYGGRDSGVDGQLVAEVVDPATGAQRAVPWPFGPPVAETVHSTWTGREVVVFVDVQTEAAAGDLPRVTRVVGFDPSTDTWRRVAPDAPSGFWSSPVWDGREVLATTPDGRLASLDVTSGETTTAPLPESYGGSLVVAPDGRLLLQQEHLYVRGAGDAEGSVWRRLPDLPSTVETVGRSLAWAGGSVVVWGGSSSGIQGEGTVNTAEGWTITPP